MYIKPVVLTAVVIILCGVLLSAKVRPMDDILYWSASHRLTFSDFKGKPDSAGTGQPHDIAASTTHRFGTISESIDVTAKSTANKVVVTIYAGMNRNLSWIRNEKDTVILKHEQGHFDICELYARLLRRKMRKCRSLYEAKQLYKTVSASEEEEQELYDKDNTHEAGGITSKWDSLIRTRLQTLDSFRKPVIILLLKNKLYNRKR